MIAAKLELAEWHTREALLRQATGEDDREDYHREAAQEALEDAMRLRWRRMTLDEIIARIGQIKDLSAAI